MGCGGCDTAADVLHLFLHLWFYGAIQVCFNYFQTLTMRLSVGGGLCSCARWIWVTFRVLSPVLQ